MNTGATCFASRRLLAIGLILAGAASSTGARATDTSTASDSSCAPAPISATRPYPRVIVSVHGGRGSEKDTSSAPGNRYLSFLVNRKGDDKDGRDDDNYYAFDLDAYLSDHPENDPTRKHLATATSVESQLFGVVRAFLQDAHAGTVGLRWDQRVHLDEVPADPDYVHQWALDEIGAPAAWNRTWGARDIVVAIVDSGIRIDDPDLSAQLWTNRREHVDGWDDDGNNIVDDIHGADYSNDVPPAECGPAVPRPSADVCDSLGHGTDMANVIGGIHDNGIGGSGIAPRVSLMPVKFTNASDFYGLASAIQAIDYAIDHGAAIINLSWSVEADDEALRAVMDKAARNSVLVVASAGNSRIDLASNPCLFPASYFLPNMIVAGTVAKGGDAVHWSGYSSSAAHNFLFAPGLDVFVSDAVSGALPRAGSSVATAVTTGATVLARSLARRWKPDRVARYIVEAAATADRNVRRLNVERATAAPVDIESTDGLDTVFSGGYRWVTLRPRFGSQVCSKVKIELVPEDPELGILLLKDDVDVPIGSHVSIGFDIPDIPRPTGNARYRARCPDSDLSTYSKPFRLR